MLKFLGSGSAFNTKLGNNGAYILNKKDKILFMIDCGSVTFSRLEWSGLLEDVERVVVLMTHTHPDHVGSLGDLIFYGYYSMGKIGEPAVTVFAPYDLKIRHLLRYMGVEEKTYKLVQFDVSGGYHYDDFHIRFEPVVVNHVPELSCYGYVIYINDWKVYYSGDCNDIPEEILAQLNEFDRIYQDTCKADYPGNVHLSLRKLDELIENDIFLRNKIYCMHLDKGFSIDEANALGFNVVENSI